MTATGEAVNDIREALARRQLSIVVGTGVTSAATATPAQPRGAPTASWTGLILDGIDRCEALGTRDADWAARARLDAQSPYDHDLIIAAEKATEGIGGRSSPEYRDWLQRAVGSLHATNTDLLDAITALADAGAMIITTNYDDLLGKSLGWDLVTWRDSTRMQRVFKGRENAVVHVHGHWRDPESIVFGASSYADVLADLRAGAFLKAMVYTNTLVFVGFGKGLHDPNFTSLRKWMRQVLADSYYKHYRLATDVEAASIVHDPDERITTIGYGEDHSDLAPFLTSIPTGLVGAGMRSLDDGPQPGTPLDRARSGDAIPLRPVTPSREDLTALAEANDKLTRIVSLATDPDRDAAAANAGGGVRLDEYVRFVNLFHDELEQVADMTRRQGELDAEKAQHVLAWARRLTTIIGE